MFFPRIKSFFHQHSFIPNATFYKSFCDRKNDKKKERRIEEMLCLRWMIQLGTQIETCDGLVNPSMDAYITWREEFAVEQKKSHWGMCLTKLKLSFSNLKCFQCNFSVYKHTPRNNFELLYFFACSVSNRNVWKREKCGEKKVSIKMHNSNSRYNFRVNGLFFLRHFNLFSEIELFPVGI